MNDYGALSAADLAKQINDDYSMILNNERANLPRALAIAEKLNALRVRARRGEWKSKFESYGLKISYETASVYLRIWEHWDDIKTLAVEKGVDPTLLTIDAARELWARRNDDATVTDDDAEDTEDAAPNGDDESDDDDSNVESDAVVRRPASWAADRVLEELELEPGDMFEVLKQVYPQDELMDLTERLAKHLGMTLMPTSKLEALAETLQPTAPV